MEGFLFKSDGFRYLWIEFKKGFLEGFPGSIIRSCDKELLTDILICLTNLVKDFQGTLEAGELHHGVWDLSAPERHNTLVECSITFFVHHLGPGLAQCAGETRHGLDSDLEGIKKIKLSKKKQ